MLLNPHKGTAVKQKKKEQKKEKKTDTLFQELKETRNNRYRRINLFIVGSLYWIEFHNTAFPLQMNIYSTFRSRSMLFILIWSFLADHSTDFKGNNQDPLTE